MDIQRLQSASYYCDISKRANGFHSSQVGLEIGCRVQLTSEILTSIGLRIKFCSRPQNRIVKEVSLLHITFRNSFSASITSSSRIDHQSLRIESINFVVQPLWRRIQSLSQSNKISEVNMHLISKLQGNHQ
jgi:hypothetical protein